MQISIKKRKIITSSFVSGLSHCSSVSMTLDDRIYHYPRELLQKLIKDDIWKKYPDICEQCIDRLYNLGQYGEVTKFCKLFLRQENN